MPIPNPDVTNPILYHERIVYVKGYANGALPHPASSITQNITTSATPNAIVTTTIIAGVANVTLRLWMVSFACFTTNTGSLWLGWRTSGTVVAIIEQSGNPNRGYAIEFPGSFVLPTGQGLAVAHQSNIASQSIRATVLYTAE